MNLLISLRSEFLKTKRTASFYLTIIAGAFGPLMSMLEIFFDGIHPDETNQILTRMFTVRFQMTGFLMLPWFLILISTLLPQVEFRNNAWKQVLSSSQSKLNVFAAKFINIQILVIVFLLTNMLVMFMNGLIVHFMYPSLHVFKQPFNYTKAGMTLASSYLGLLAISSIQFWLGLRFRNFIAPIAIGIAAWFIGMILVMQKVSFAAYFPYSFYIYGKYPAYKPESMVVAWTSVILAAVFFALGYLDFRKRRMTA